TNSTTSRQGSRTRRFAFGAIVLPHRVATASGAATTSTQRQTPPCSLQPQYATAANAESSSRKRSPSFAGRKLDRLELLERLPAVAAVAERAARRRAEDVLERGVARAAIRAAEAVRLQLHQR